MKITKRELELLSLKHKRTSTREYLKDVSRLAAGEPVDYVLGNSEFLGATIDLSYKPLIPRVETEYWVEKAITEIPAGEKMKILDIFSGSGCIGIAVGKRLKKAEIHFADSEENCIKQIKKNIKLNKLKNKTKVIKSNVFKNINGKFNVIFANPPYIPTGRKKTLPKSVVSYESGKYLFSGKDGLSAIRAFAEKVLSRLLPGGVVYMEFDSGQYAKVKKIFKSKGFEVDIRKDQYEKYRWARINTKNGKLKK